ncbi:MAG: hypothetical protein HQ592_14535 [Planctomycetes bacterium]|nr:hypothetical protein [Planctomycetota bacterium]
MKQFLTFVMLVSAACGIVASRPALGQDHADRYWKVDDVRVGMKGVGKTVMEGRKIEEFRVEVIGILKKVFPNQDIFLAELSGLGLEQTGIIEGMSGSPVYIDGKLLGAVAYGWSFSKKPIAGITPAEQMYTLVAEAEKPNAEGASAKPQGFRRPPGRMFAGLPGRTPASSGDRAAGGAAAFKRLRAPLVISGCPEPVFRHYATRFEKMGLLPVQGGGAGGAREPADAPELVPGAPLAIVLIEGDMIMAGIGTVTDVIDDEVIAFGHPMMDMGRVELPMAAATVDAVIPSMWTSFKLSTAGKTVGTLLVDRIEGIYGRTGQVPPMVPLSIAVDREDFPGRAKYSYRVADSEELMPYMLDICLFSSVFMKGNLPPEYTIEYKISISTDKGDVIELENMSASSSWSSLWSFFDAVSSTAYGLTYNPFEKVRITDVKAQLSMKLGDRTALVDSARLLDAKTAPGKSARVRVGLRHYRRPPTTLEMQVPIPSDLPPGLYNITITDSDGAWQAAAAAEPSRFDPQNYNEMLQLLKLQYPNNNIYALIALPNTGLDVSGTPLRNLPPSYLSMLTPVGRSKNLFITTVLQTSKQTEYHITGSQDLLLLVEKED